MIDMLYDILNLCSLLIPCLIDFDALQFSIRFVIFFRELMLADSIYFRKYQKIF